MIWAPRVLELCNEERNTCRQIELRQGPVESHKVPAVAGSWPINTSAGQQQPLEQPLDVNNHSRQQSETSSNLGSLPATQQLLGSGWATPTRLQDSFLQVPQDFAVPQNSAQEQTPNSLAPSYSSTAPLSLPPTPFQY